MHLAQALAHQRKLLLQRRVQAFVDRHADALQILVSQIRQARHALVNLLAKPVARSLTLHACRPRQRALLATQVIQRLAQAPLQQVQALRCQLILWLRAQHNEQNNH